MITLDRLGDKHDLSLQQIEKIVKSYQREYPYHEFEVNRDEEGGELNLWMDDCNREVFIMTIVPSEKDLKQIDTEGICDVKPARNYVCPLGLGEYDWLRGRKTCNCCRKCFNFKAEI